MPAAASTPTASVELTSNTHVPDPACKKREAARLMGTLE
jgi:hypothetical protein